MTPPVNAMMCLIIYLFDSKWQQVWERTLECLGGHEGLLTPCFFFSSEYFTKTYRDEEKGGRAEGEWGRTLEEHNTAESWYYVHEGWVTPEKEYFGSLPTGWTVGAMIYFMARSMVQVQDGLVIQGKE